jgi:hypothetical protein
MRRTGNLAPTIAISAVCRSASYHREGAFQMSSKIEVEVEGGCPKCGRPDLVIPENYTDETIVHCPSCGPLARWGDVVGTRGNQGKLAMRIAHVTASIAVIAALCVPAVAREWYFECTPLNVHDCTEKKGCVVGRETQQRSYRLIFNDEKKTASAQFCADGTCADREELIFNGNWITDFSGWNVLLNETFAASPTHYTRTKGGPALTPARDSQMYVEFGRCRIVRSRN